MENLTNAINMNVQFNKGEYHFWKFFGMWSLLIILAFSAPAQNPPAGSPQKKPIALVGGTIHTGTGQVIKQGVIVFNSGIITAIGDATTAFDRSSTDVIDTKGKHVYPGAIAMGTTVGIQEIAAVRATLDFAEIGDINPHVRSLVAYNTDSEVIPTLRNASVLLAQSVPQGGLIAGTSSVFMTDGWNWEDAVLKKDDGVWLNWPPFVVRTFNGADFSTSIKRNERRQEVINVLESTFYEAKGYADLSNPSPVNLRLAALKGLFDGSKNLYVNASYAKDIIEAVKFAKKVGVKKVVINGAEESYRVADFLKAQEVPVILAEIHRLPSKEDESVYTPYELPGLLHKAGVLVALSYGNEWWRVRNLNYLAGTAAAYGEMDKEEALKFITLHPAKIMGIDQYAGSLEPGKHATLVVTQDDMLEMRSNIVEQAYIKGSKVNLDDKQKRLYEKYKEKYAK